MRDGMKMYMAGIGSQRPNELTPIYRDGKKGWYGVARSLGARYIFLVKVNKGLRRL